MTYIYWNGAWSDSTHAARSGSSPTLCGLTTSNYRVCTKQYKSMVTCRECFSLFDYYIETRAKMCRYFRIRGRHICTVHWTASPQSFEGVGPCSEIITWQSKFPYVGRHRKGYLVVDGVRVSPQPRQTTS